jgi:hypothetical protein
VKDMYFSLLRKKDGLDFIIQLLIAGFFFFTYAFLFSRVVPKGINHYFLARFLTVFWPLLIGIVLLLAVIFFLKKKTFKLEQINGTISFYDLFLMFLPLSPIVQYIILNKNILCFLDSVILLFCYLVIIIFFCFVFPLIFSFFGYQKILMILGASFCFMIFNMPSLAVRFKWHLKGYLIIQVIVFLSVFFVIVFFHYFNNKILAIMIVAFFISLIASSVYRVYIEKDEKRDEDEKSLLLYTLTENKEMFKTPDIFLMTYDSYVENKTMLQYGIDNSGQEEFLIQNGFYIYKGVYSVGADTLSSMDKVLEVSVIVKPCGNGVSGNGAVQNILKEKGYKTYGIFNNGYMFSGLKPAYHEAYPKIDNIVLFSFSSSLIFKQVLEGEFRFDAGFERFVFSDFIACKRSILKNKNNSPKFLYTHSGPGHSQNSGKCLDNEIELFEKRLLDTNEEMKEDIATIIQNNPDAIVIVNGDHGPYLTKNCIGLRDYNKNEINRLDIQDRYGSFLAIRWPGDTNIKHEEIKILQDIFPMVFSYLFNDNSILDSRIPKITRDFNALPDGITVKNGIIVGGLNDGEPLFE